jgi:hypothetical protein
MKYQDYQGSQRKNETIPHTTSVPPAAGGLRTFA